MAELAHCESADSSEDLGKNPNSVSNKWDTWERIEGIYPARYHRHVTREGFISEYYHHHCPRCDNHRLPNVSQSRWMPRDWQILRTQHAWQHHCNRCKVTWAALDAPFCSRHYHKRFEPHVPPPETF